MGSIIPQTSEIIMKQAKYTIMKNLKI